MFSDLRARRSSATLGIAVAFLAGSIATTPAAVAGSLEDPVVASAEATGPTGAPPDEGVIEDKAVPDDKLGDHDRELLAGAQTAGDASVTVLLATERGRAPAVADDVAGLGGAVGYRDDDLGYVRAELPTGAVEKAATSVDVVGVDLDERIQSPDPTLGIDPDGHAVDAPPAPPGAQTPLDNPYLPISEIGAASFLRSNPTWDGRGITIGILDTGIDLDHPSLQVTSTGERKIVDWVTATDPLVDGDLTWRPMLTTVQGPRFAYADATWTAPDGEFFINRFSEDITSPSEVGGDVNRDGDVTDQWGVLYRASDNAIWVDLDQDLDFTDEELRRPYREAFQVGHLGTDDPGTPVQESLPFVVEFRQDVSLEPAGLDGTADFVNIGIVESAHGSHVAGVAAGHALFGGAMSGVAPGAKLVSARACSWGTGCTVVALTEGMIDLVVNRDVDVVNMSIGGLPALNDANNARAVLYDRLIADHGVQMFLSAGNDGPGLNTVGDPGVVTDVISVGASVSRDTWFANYGSRVPADHATFTFSSRGPREDGGFKPDITAPGAAISTTPLWQEGSPVAETGYPLPPGYAMFNGTSMASPMAAGGAALLLSAARDTQVTVTPAQLRKAIHSTADFDRRLPSYEQGAGQLDVPDAWRLLRLGERLVPVEYDVSAPVCTVISDLLATPGRGPGVYDRCAAADGGAVAGLAKTYDITVTRRSGPAGDRLHAVRTLGDDGTFRVQRIVRLPLGEPVTLSVRATPDAGAHGMVLQLDDPQLRGIEKSISVVVVAAAEVPAPTYTWTTSGSVDRARTESYFITVPEGAAGLRVSLSGIAPGSETRFIAIHPYGMAWDDVASTDCWTNRSEDSACDPHVRTYTNPMPGVWEIELEGRRTSPTTRNPYHVAAEVLGVDVEPAVVDVASARVGDELPVSWTVTNRFAPVTLVGLGSPLGSAVRSRPTIADQRTATFTVDVPELADRLDVRIGSPSDLGADLDLTVLFDGVVVGSDADGDSEESVSLWYPVPGTYTIEVFAYGVPAGTTEYDYVDVYFAEALGALHVQGGPFELPAGGSATVNGLLTVGAAPGKGRQLFADMSLVTPPDGVVGTGSVVVREVVP